MMRFGPLVVCLTLCSLVGLGPAQAANFYVQKSVGDDANPGDSWGAGHALATIKKALDLAATHAGADTIHVAAGEYPEHLVVGGDVTLLGSYPAGGAGARDRIATPSVIHGYYAWLPVVIDGVSNVTVDGFGIVGGAALPPGGILFGGGVSISNANRVRIVDNRVYDCVAQAYGGGVYVGKSADVLVAGTELVHNWAALGGGLMADESSLTLTRNVVHWNRATGDGAGVAWVRCPEISVEDNTIVDNFAGQNGGGISVSSGPTGRVVRNTIQRNSADNRGGGASLSDDVRPSAFENNVITGNSAGNLGGGVSIVGRSSAVVVNTTIANNSAGEGGGLYIADDSSATLTNDIVWGNSPEQIANLGTIQVSYSDVQGGWAGMGNIDAEPQFVAAGDYHLAAGSPCVDAGSIAGAPAEDRDGLQRPGGMGIDMGAYEYGAAAAAAVPAFGGIGRLLVTLVLAAAGAFALRSR